MSGRLPAVNSRRALAALKQAGFVVDRIVGSHHIMRHRDNPSRFVTVPVHGGRDLKTGTLRSIIRQAGLSPDEFKELL